MAFTAPESPLEDTQEQSFFGFEDTARGMWDALRGLKVTAPAAYYRAIEGLARPDQYSLKSQAAREREGEFLAEMDRESELRRAKGESTTVGDAFRSAAPSTGFSLGGIASAIPLARAGAAAGSAVPGVGTAAGGVVGGLTGAGTSAYRMSGSQFLEDTFEAMEQKAKEKYGRSMSEDEKEKAYQVLLPIAQNYALWEAGPEAVGTVATLGLGKLALNIGKPALDKLITGAVGKAATRLGAGGAAVGTELGTEGLTTMQQGLAEAQAKAFVEGKPIEEAKSRFDKEGGFMEATKEVAPATLAQMLLLGGGMKTLDLSVKGISELAARSKNKNGGTFVAPEEEVPVEELTRIQTLTQRKPSGPDLPQGYVDNEQAAAQAAKDQAFADQARNSKFVQDAPSQVTTIREGFEPNTDNVLEEQPFVAPDAEVVTPPRVAAIQSADALTNLLNEQDAQRQTPQAAEGLAQQLLAQQEMLAGVNQDVQSGLTEAPEIDAEASLVDSLVRPFTAPENAPQAPETPNIKVPVIGTDETVELPADTDPDVALTSAVAKSLGVELSQSTETTPDETETPPPTTLANATPTQEPDLAAQANAAAVGGDAKVPPAVSPDVQASTNAIAQTGVGTPSPALQAGEEVSSKPRPKSPRVRKAPAQAKATVKGPEEASLDNILSLLDKNKKGPATKTSSERVLALAKADGLDLSGKWWGNPVNVQAVVDAVDTGDFSKLPPRPRKVAEDVAAGKTPESIAEEAERLEAEARAKDAELLRSERADQKRVKKSTDKKAKKELEQAEDQIDQLRQQEDRDDAESFIESTAKGYRLANPTPEHLSQVQRQLAQTPAGRWVWSRVEQFKTAEEAEKSFGFDPGTVGNIEGFLGERSGRAAVILDNVTLKKGETPAQALRRVMVHEAIGHGGFRSMLEAFPEMRAEYDALRDKAKAQGFNYKTKAGIIRSVESDPTTVDWNDDRKFEEWFARSIESLTPEALAGGAALRKALEGNTLLAQVLDFLKKVVGKLLGQPWTSRNVEIAALDLAQRIMRNVDRFENPSGPQPGGGVIPSKGNALQTGMGMTYSLPEVGKKGDIWTLAGKQIGREGVTDVNGLKSIGKLKDAEINLYKQLVPEAFANGRVSIPKLVEGLEKSGPVIEVKKFGEGSLLTPEARELRQLIHWFDGLGGKTQELLETGIHEGIDADTISKYNRLSELDAAGHREGAAAQYAFVAPKAESDMPGYVEGLVRVPIADTSGIMKEPDSVKALKMHQKKAKETLYSGPHFGSEDTNVVSFFRGYEETLPDGRKVFHVIEVQSDWAQQQQKRKKLVDDPEHGDYNRARLAESDHPLLEAYESIALKAAIKHAKEIGADAIALSDGETTMMSEGHDVGIVRPDYGVWNRTTGQFEDGLPTREGAERVAKEIVEDHGHDVMVLDPNTAAQPMQAKGMRLHYDQKLPSELKRLTGNVGEMVDFGVHEKAKNSSPLMVGDSRNPPIKGSPVFRNADGAPKSSITARLYPLDKLEQEPYAKRNAELLASTPDEGLTIPPPEKNWWQKIRAKASAAYSEIAQPLLSVADKINPAVGNMFRLYEREGHIAAKDTQDRTHLAFSGLAKVKNKEDSDALWMAVENDKAKAVELMKKNGATDEEIAQFQGLFGENGTFRYFLKQRKELGLPSADLGPDYFPRRLRQDRLPEFQQWLYDNKMRLDEDPIVNEIKREKRESWDKKAGQRILDVVNQRNAALAGNKTTEVERLNKLIAELQEKREAGKFFTDQEEIEMQSEALRRNFAQKGRGGSFKGRRIKELEDSLAGFYERPSIALQKYIAEQARAIPMARVFGANAYNLFRSKDSLIGEEEATMPEKPSEIESVFDQNAPAGKIIYDLKKEGKLNGEQLRRLRDITQALLGHLPPHDLIQKIKKLNVPLVLANPISALKQIPSEWALAAQKYGFWNAVKASAAKGMLNVEDLNLNPTYEIAHGNDKLGVVAQKLARISGFRKADLYAAGVLANAHLLHLQGLSPQKRMEELSQWKDILEGADKDKALQEVSDAIRDGDWNNKNVHNVAFYNLSKDRPVGLSSMPLGFLKSRGVGNLFYNLRGWGFFNLNRHKENIWDNVRSGEPERIRKGLTDGLYLASVMVLAGAGADAVADWMMGKPVKFSDRFQDNILKMAFASTYQANQLFGDRPDFKGTVLNYLNTPALDVANGFWKSGVTALRDEKKDFIDLLAHDKSAMRAIPLGVGTIVNQHLLGTSRSDAADRVDQGLPDEVERLTKEASSLRDLGETGRKRNPVSQLRWEKLSQFGRVKKHYVDKAKKAALDGDYQEMEANVERLAQIARDPSRWAVEARIAARAPVIAQKRP